MERGLFIVFEGLDGAGKTTQVERLKAKLESLGKTVVLTAEPTELPSGKALREVLGGKIKKSDCEISLMFTLDRIAHNIDKNCGIERLLSEGACVICDRYYYSTLAYQGSLVDYGWLKKMNTECPEIRHPDLCIFLDLAPEESMRRISRRNESVEIYENAEMLARVRESFMRVVEDLGQSDNIYVIDASGDIDTVAQSVFDAVKRIV